MASRHAVSKERHAHKRWKPYTSYAFAAADAITPLVVQELPKAALALPVAFALDGDAFVPVAVQGIQPGQNLLVGADGRWLASYVPATYRGYPFTLANTTDDQKVLCVFESDDVLSDDEGEPFFDDEGEPATRLTSVIDFLKQVAVNRETTGRLCAVLQQHNLIQPWPITLKTDSGDKTVQGLHRVDEAALNQLPADALLEIRNAGALPMAYCQLLSMQHLPKLVDLAKAQAESAATLPAAADGELDLEFLNDGDTISFGNLN